MPPKRKPGIGKYAPQKRQEPPPPCAPGCKCLDCFDEAQVLPLDEAKLLLPNTTASALSAAEIFERSADRLRPHIEFDTRRGFHFFGDWLELWRGNVSRLEERIKESEQLLEQRDQEIQELKLRLRDHERTLGEEMNLVVQSTVLDCSFEERRLKDYEAGLGPEKPPPPPAKTYSEAAVQASPPPKTYTEAVIQASPPSKTYAEVATQVTPPAQAVMQASPPPKTYTEAATQAASSPPPSPLVRKVRAVVLHAAPTHRKVGEIRRWLEKDNRGVRILGARWLLQEARRLGKIASSLVLYLSTPITTGKLRMGHKCFRTTEYDWDRPAKDKGKGKGV